MDWDEAFQEVPRHDLLGLADFCLEDCPRTADSPLALRQFVKLALDVATMKLALKYRSIAKVLDNRTCPKGSRKMHIEFAFLGREAAVAQGTFFVRGGGISEIRATELPTYVMVLHLITQIVLDPAECNRDHELVLEVRGRDGAVAEQMAPIKFNLPLRPDRSDKSVTQVAVVDLSDIVYPVPGDYLVRLSVDGHHLKSVPLELRLTASGEPEDG